LIKRKYDKVINIFGADHYGYGPRLRAALSAFGVDSQRIDILIAQMVRLIKDGKEFKMSKRKGVFVTLEDLIKDVGLDAARFFFLARSLETQMDFDMSLAKERSKKNPVYYVQYAGARMSSILKKSQFSIFNFQSIFKFPASPAGGQKLNTQERNLILKLIQFPEIIESVSEDYQVQRITTYAYELAKTFTDFYENVRVLNAESEELKKFRLNLVFMIRKILVQTLKLLGISAPEKM